VKKIFLIFFLTIFSVNSSPKCFERSDIFFHVYRNGSKIGYHKINFSRNEDYVKASVEIKFEVTFLGFVVYDYYHKNEENWLDDSLVNLRTTTDKNGESLFCNLNKKNDVFVVEGSIGNEEIFNNIIPTSYWNHKLIVGRSTKHVLNTQDCSFIDLSIKPLGEKEIYDVALLTNHYKLTGKESSGEALDIDIWYDQNENWVKMIFIKDGSKIEYYLDRFYEKEQ